MALALSLPACTASDRCREPGTHPALAATLLFGRTREADSAWPEFLKTVITPRFPDGLTVLEATGQFQNPQTGAIGSEASRVVLIVTADSPRIGTKLAEIAGAYKSRFHQQSVGILLAPTCAAF